MPNVSKRSARNATKAGTSLYRRPLKRNAHSKDRLRIVARSWPRMRTQGRRPNKGLHPTKPCNNQSRQRMLACQACMHLLARLAMHLKRILIFKGLSNSSAQVARVLGHQQALSLSSSPLPPQASQLLYRVSNDQLWYQLPTSNQRQQRRIHLHV